MEARFQKELALKEFHRRFVPQLTNAPVTGSVRLTYGTDVKGGVIMDRRGGGERSGVALQNWTTRRLP